MEFFDYTNKNAVKQLATKTRRSDISSYELSETHKQLGNYLAGSISEFLDMKDITISHPQGKRTGDQIDESDIIIIGLWRAGLYVAEGIRSVLQNSPLLLVKPVKNKGLSEKDRQELPNDLSEKHIIIADSVINTGGSMLPVLDELHASGAKSIHIASLVMPTSTAKKIKEIYINHSNVYIHTIRTSENSYIGKGGTDTGNRLFGDCHA